MEQQTPPLASLMSKGLLWTALRMGHHPNQGGRKFFLLKSPLKEASIHLSGGIRAFTCSAFPLTSPPAYSGLALTLTAV